MGRITRTGAWLSVLPPTANGTELEAQEWRDSLFIPYGIDPPDLPEHYNGCGMTFDLYNSLDCKKGGLITAHHNKLLDGVSDLARKVFTPMHVHDDPKTYTCCDMHGGKDKVKG